MHARPIRRLPAGRKIRVLVVDDSVVIRRLVCHALEEDQGVEVAGFASNGVAALERIPQLDPDVITLDIEMPEMDGLEMLRHVRREYPGIRVIMFSTLTSRGAAATLDALALGADDYVAKASNAGALDLSLLRLRGELLPRIHQFFQEGEFKGELKGEAPRATVLRVASGQVRAIAIGVSTGGPAALGEIMPRFPGDLPVPLFLVQHMPPMFTRFLAERLDAVSPLTVLEAAGGEEPRPGCAYVAPGDYHLKLVRSGGQPATTIDQAPPENSCRPAVDVLFRSMAEVYGGAVIAAVLTGMGQDGMRGAIELKARGGRIIVQDEASSVVWGMPGSVVRAGAADQVVPLEGIVPAILEHL
jgi:two-component system, chemotaxis family, protein-glutamate methylesterase/glutaminase